MIARAIIELPVLKQQESNPSVLPQVADQSKQSFSSLLASSKAAAEANPSIHGHPKAGSSQKVDDEEEPSDGSPSPKEAICQAGPVELPLAILPPVVILATPDIDTKSISGLSSPAQTKALQPPPGSADTAIEPAAATDQGENVIQDSGVLANAKGTQLSTLVLSPATYDSASLRKVLSAMGSIDAADILPKLPTAPKAPNGESVATAEKTPTLQQDNQGAPAETLAQVGLNIPVMWTVESVENGSVAGVRPSKSGLTKVESVSAVDSSTFATAKVDGSSTASKSKKASEDGATTTGDAQTVQAIVDNGRLQAGNSTQNVDTAPMPATSTIHLVPTPTNLQNIISAPHSTSVPANSDRSAATSAENVTSSPSVISQPLPTINTARLIQSMGQSEMRLGMRSEEFGNISIHTSTTKDLLSAQISIDNGDLAKVLATHLPEIRIRLESNQGGEVRVDMNGQGSQAGTSNGTPSQSQDESRGDKRATGQGTTGSSANNAVANQIIMSAAAMSPGNNGTNARLDIRI